MLTTNFHSYGMLNAEILGICVVATFAILFDGCHHAVVILIESYLMC